MSNALSDSDNRAATDMPAAPPQRRARKIFWFLVKLAIALGIIGYLYGSQWHELTGAVRNVNNRGLFLACLAFGFLLYLTHLLAGALRWYLLLRSQRLNISLYEAFSYSMQAFFFALVIPGGAIGGDLVKIGFVATKSPKGTRFAGAFSVLVDRVFGMIGLFTTAAIAVALTSRLLLDMKWRSLARYGVPDSFPAFLMLFLGVGFVGGIVAAIALFNHRYLERFPLTRWLFPLMNKFSGGRVGQLMDALDLYREAPKTLFACAAISVFGIHMVLALVGYFLGLGLTVNAPPLSIFLLAITLGNVASLIPGSFAGVGPRDLVTYEILRAGGLPEGVALAVPAFYSAFAVLFNLSGCLFFVFSGSKKNDGQAAEPPIENKG